MNSFLMPEESDRHERTWMSFVASRDIWSRRQIPAVKRDLVLIATTIAKYEPVSILVGPDDYREAVSLLGGLDAHEHPISLIPFATNDLWVRDTGPTFVRDRDRQKYGLNFNFNGWGNKQEHALDAQVSDFITESANAIVQATPLVLEGGCFEIDGDGTAILTKSSVLNENRNPGMSQAEVEDVLKTLLGLRKIIWLEGLRGRDITDSHIDFYARFSKKGAVIASRDNDPDSYDYAVTRENIDVLKAATDADNNLLNVMVIDAPASINESYGISDFAAGYVGYYVCNDAVIMQKFGDSVADDNAKTLLTAAFPNRTIEQISINGIASGGGSIHCATQQEPKI